MFDFIGACKSVGLKKRIKKLLAGKYSYFFFLITKWFCENTRGSDYNLITVIKTWSALCKLHKRLICLLQVKEESVILCSLLE